MFFPQTTIASPPAGIINLNKNSLQYKGLALIMAPYLRPGTIGGNIPDPMTGRSWVVHTSGVSWQYEPGFGMVPEFDGNLGNIKYPSTNSPYGSWPLRQITISWWHSKFGVGGASGGRIFQNSTYEALIYGSGTQDLVFTDRRTNGNHGSWLGSGHMPNDSIPRLITITHVNDLSVDPILYVNGVLQSGMSENVTPTGTYTVRGGASRNVGNNNDSGVRGFDGRIWDFRVYGRVFSPSEVMQLYDPATRFDLYRAAENFWQFSQGIEMWPFIQKYIRRIPAPRSRL